MQGDAELATEAPAVCIEMVNITALRPRMHQLLSDVVSSVHAAFLQEHCIPIQKATSLVKAASAASCKLAITDCASTGAKDHAGVGALCRRANAFCHVDAKDQVLC